MADYNYRPVEERLRDWKEVQKNNTEVEFLKNQAKQCMDCGVPFCQLKPPHSFQHRKRFSLKIFYFFSSFHLNSEKRFNSSHEKGLG